MTVAMLPPYAHLNQEAVQCVAQAAARYLVPELLLHAVLLKESGRMGQCSKNRNGTLDCGLAQINTVWASYFERQGVSWQAVSQDTCTNVAASAYILKYNFLRKKENWVDATIAYNIGPNNWTPVRYGIGYRYAQDVVSRWWGLHAWVAANVKPAQAAGSQ